MKKLTHLFNFQLSTSTIMRSLLGMLLFLMSFLTAYAQTFPVQSSLQLTPPYSLKLPDYVSPGTERMVLNALLTDISRAQLDVELRLTIEGQGILIQTSPTFNPEPITLISGVNIRLSGLDLEPYFRAENLDFLGIGEQEFMTNGGSLPEGIYRFCIEIVEFNREVAVARSSCATAWLVLNDPPIINLPGQGEKLEPIEPQYVRFQWTPRHTGSPNSAFSTEYDFTLVEVWPSDRNPNDAILTTTPIYETSTMATSLVYGPAEPALVRGRHYAFRVQARNVTGVEPLDLFRNDGFSEVQYFIYGDECITPDNVSASSFSSRKIDVYWDADPVHTGFLVKYRKQGDVSWMEEKVLFNDYTLTGLIPDTEYEIQVVGICGSSTSEESNIYKTKTEAEIEGDFSCGAPPESFNLDNTSPLPSLKEGDVIRAGDFDVSMIEVTGSNGTFSGKGQIVLPMMNHVKAGTEFSNIKVNDEFRMYDGQMHFTAMTAQVLTDEQLEVVEEAFDYIEELEEDIMGALDVAQEVADSINSFVEEMQNTDVFTEEEYEEFISDETGVEELREMVTDALEAAAQAAASGDIVEAAKQISIAQAANSRAKTINEQASQADTVQNAAVRFVAGTYGMDVGPGHNGIEPNYYKIITDQGDEYGPWFSAEEGKSLVITTEWISDSGVPKDSITFTLADAAIDATTTNAGWDLSIPSGTADEKRVLKALYNGNTVGIAAVVFYKLESRKVTLVKVNGATMPTGDEAQSYLNEVFGPAIVEWEVATAEVTVDNSWDLNSNGSMYVEENNDLSVYPDEVKALNSAVKAELETIENDRYYVLFTNIENSADAGGFMPRKKQFGLVFDGKTHTLAHELGHGAFRLAHTWEDHPNLSPGDTENLMDYTPDDKKNLRQYQWDEIHNPKWVISLFDDEEELLYDPWTKLNYGQTISHIPDVSDEEIVSFIAPTGLIYSLPGKVQDISFSEQGYLVAFTLDRERYVGFNKSQKYNYEFTGYRYDNIEIEDTDKYINDPNSEYPQGFIDTNSKNIDFSKDVYVYYILAGESGDCSQIKLYKNLYKGDHVSEDNTGYNDNNLKDLYKSEEKDLINSGVITVKPENYSTISDDFNCLTAELKFLKKYIQYKHGEENDFNISFLDDLISQLRKFKTVSITEFDNAETAPKIEKWTLKLEEYGDIQLFKDAIETYFGRSDSDPTNTRLELSLINGDEEDLFVSYLSYLVPFSETFEAIMGCINNENTLSLDGYYVPYCYWKDQSVTSLKYYSIEDPAFTSGFVDGAIATVHDLFNLVAAFEKQKVSWTYLNFECAESTEAFINEYLDVAKILKDIGFNISSYSAIETTRQFADYFGTESFQKALKIEIAALEYIKNKSTSLSDAAVKEMVAVIEPLKESFPEKFEERARSVEKIAKFFLNPLDAVVSESMTCEDAEKAREQLKQVLGFLEQLSNPANTEVRDQTFQSISDSFNQYIDATVSLDNYARYNHGRVIFEIALEIASAVFTGGAGNVATKIDNVLKLSAKTIQEATKFAAKQMKGIPDLVFNKNKLLRGSDELIEIGQEGLYKVKKHLDTDAEGFELQDSEAIFRDVEYELPDGTRKRGDLEIVTDGNDSYVRVMKMAFSDIYDNVLKLDGSDLTKVADDIGANKAVTGELAKVTSVEIRGKTYDLPEGSKIVDAGDGKYFIPGFCFVAGTPIKVSQYENKPIETIEKGQQVFSFDHQSQSPMLSKVNSLFSKTVNRLVKVMISGSLFLSTVDHPYYANGQYVEASKLQDGDKVLSYDGSYGRVESVEIKDTTATVYNFEVADNHNYFIGEAGYLVHNDCNMKRIDEVVSASNISNSKVTSYYDKVKGLNKEKRLAINERVAKLSDEALVKFIDDFGDAADLSKFIEKPELVNSWDVLFKEGDEIAAALRRNPDNLKKLNDYVVAEGADLTKLKNSFGNTAYPEKWLELKIPKNKLDETFTTIKNDPPANIDPWTPEHKAQRWNNYKEGDGTLDFESWSNSYDGNINKAVKGNKKVKDYASNNGLDIPESGFERTWKDPETGFDSKIEIDLRGEKVEGFRRHDIYDEDLGKAIEVKDYRTQNVSRSVDIEREALMDIKLLKQGLLEEVEWVFLGNGPSGPLRELLIEGGIKISP